MRHHVSPSQFNNTNHIFYKVSNNLCSSLYFQREFCINITSDIICYKKQIFLNSKTNYLNFSNTSTSHTSKRLWLRTNLKKLSTPMRKTLSEEQECPLGLLLVESKEIFTESSHGFQTSRSPPQRITLRIIGLTKSSLISRVTIISLKAVQVPLQVNSLNRMHLKAR